MQKRRRVNYATKKRLAEVNPKNIKHYEEYRMSRLAANSDVKDTTYKVYQSYFNHFLIYVSENWDNIDILSKIQKKRSRNHGRIHGFLSGQIRQ